MSVNFQNAEAVKQAIFEELRNCLSSDREVLQQAEQRIKQLEYTDGYGVYLTEIIMNQSYDLHLRQIASIMLTRYVENHWCDDERGGDVNVAVLEQAKRTIRNILPNGLYDPNSKIRLSVAHTIASIASTDWPTHWPELFNIIVKCLGGNEDSIHGAVHILNEFTYDETQIKELGPVVISEVYRIFESEQSYSIKTRTSAVGALKSLFVSINENITDPTEHQNMVNSILSNFMDKFVHYLSMNSGNNSSFMLRSQIAKILTYLTTEMPKAMQPFIERLMPVVWQLLTQIADTYVKVEVNRIEVSPFHDTGDVDEDELTNFSNTIIQIFEFIQSVINVPKLSGAIRNVLTDLIYIIIVFMQISEVQIEDWTEDPEKYVEDEDDVGAEITIRIAGQDVLQLLRDDFEPLVLPALQAAIARHMTVADAEKASGNPFWWKIQEACMAAVHNFRDNIISSQDQFELANYLTMVRSFLNCQEYEYLVGRALWTLSTYSKSDLYNEQMLEEILGVTLQTVLPEKSIVLKICAVRAIYEFYEAHATTEDGKRAILKAKVPEVIDGVLGAIPATKSSVLALMLEALTSIIIFDSTMADISSHEKIIPLTVAVFLKYSEDPFLLEIVQDLVKALCKNPTCALTVQTKFVPTLIGLIGICEDEAIRSKQDLALDVLTTIVKNATAPLSELLIGSAFPGVIECVLKSEDTSVMVAGGECIRAFVLVSPEQVIGFNNGEGLDSVINVTTMLLNPMNSESTAGQIGPLVITIITKVGNILGEHLDLLLKAVLSKMQLVESLKVMMNLVVVFAHLCLTQMEAVLNFLSTVPGPTGEPALQFVFNNWLSKHSAFYGVYERKVTTMALCKLFEYGVTSQDTRLTSLNIMERVTSDNSPQIRTRSQTASDEQWVAIPTLVKIFKLLISELKFLKEIKALDLSSSEDEEEIDPTKAKHYHCSDIIQGDEDETEEDDHLSQDLLNDPMFQLSMDESLTKFLQNFSTNEHFGTFVSHLTDSEKSLLRSIEIEEV